MDDSTNKGSKVPDRDRPADVRANQLEHPIMSRMRALRYVPINHGVTFLVFAILGTFTLLFIKTHTDHLSFLLYFTVAFIIMGGYFFVNMLNLYGLRLRYDQLGDNLYYLGFVYTLGALAHTLYVYSGEPGNIRQVIASFGIALTSTILGVVLRIVAHLMRIDPHDIDDAVRSELLDVAVRVKSSLDTVVRDLTVFGDQTRQSIGELHAEVQKDIANHAAQMSQASSQVVQSVDASSKSFNANTVRVSELTDQAATQVIAMSKRVLEVLELSHEESTKHTSRLSILNGETIRALEQLVAKIDALSPPTDLLEAKLLPATEQVNRIVNVMSRIAEQEEKRSARLQEVTESMVEGLGALRDQMHVISSAANQQEIANRVGIAAKALGDMSVTVVALRDQVVKLVDFEAAAVSGLRAEYHNTVAQIREHNVELRKELNDFRSLTAGTHAALVDLAKALRSAV